MKYAMIILTTFFFSFFTYAQLAPAPPSKDATSQSRVQDAAPLNLPYQPKDPTTIPDLTIPTTLSGDQTPVEIDWTKIPFIPFKTPELPPAPDPVI